MAEFSIINTAYGWNEQIKKRKYRKKDEVYTAKFEIENFKEVF